MKRDVWLSEGALIIVTMIWGLGFPITKLAVESGYGPNTIIFMRFLVASILIGIIVRRRILSMGRTYLIFGFVSGVFLFLGFYFQTLGAVYTTPSKNAFITQLNIVFVPFLAIWFSKQKLDGHNVLAVLIAICGLYLIAFEGRRFQGMNMGDVFTFICALLVAFHVVTASHFQKKFHLYPALFVFVSMVTAMFLALFFVPFETIPVITLGNVWPLFFLGLFNTALGFSVQSIALKVSQPTRISLIVSLEGLFGAIGSVLIIREVLSVYLVVGGFMILTGIVLTELKPFRRRRKTPKMA